MNTPPTTCKNCGENLGTTGNDLLCPRCRAGTKRGAFVPRRFGDYDLLDEIARGGMGVVYRARELSLNRIVALKMIRDSALASPTAVQRFRLEAEAAATLSHPHIVPIYEFGEVDGHWFLGMKLIEGTDLARLQKGVPMDPRPLAKLMATLARAIHYAHQRGVLHRDLKPANVLLDPAHEPHLTDFGLAKFTDEDGAVTHSADIVGSPNYMAPEQASGKSTQLTTAADIYSLGAIMYELLCGRAPFRADSPLEVLHKVLSEEPAPPRELYRFADRDLETVCLKCLEKEPARRYGSAEAFAEDLERWLDHKPIAARPSTPVERVTKWMHRNPRVATLVVLLHVVFGLGLGGVLWMSYRAQASARESHVRLLRMHLTEGNRLVNAGEDFQGLLWFVEALRLETGGPEREENHRQRIAAVLRHAPRLLQVYFHGDWVYSAEFSPDGSRLVTGASDRTSRVWNTGTGAAVLPPMPHTAGVQVSRFSPDGRLLLTFDKQGNARLWNALDGTPATPPMRAADFDTQAIPGRARKLNPSAVFSPDGRSVLTAWGSRAAHVWDAAGGHERFALAHAGLVHHAGYSRDGKRIVTSGQDGTARVWDAESGKPLSAPLKHSGFVGWSQFSPDGRRLMTVADRMHVHVWDWSAGRELIAPLTHGEVLFGASWSPDGSRLLTASWDKSARVWDANSGLPVARFNHPGGLDGAEFSPDGRWIATACYDGTARVWDIEKHTLALPALPNGGAVEGVRFSPDGRQLAVATWHGSVHLWDLTLGSSVLKTLPQRDAIATAFSPDGKRVAIASGSPGSEVRIWDAASGRDTLRLPAQTGEIHIVVFHPSGSHLLTAGDDRAARLWDASTGKESTPPLVHPETVLDAAFGPDGRQVATAGSDGAGRLWDTGTGRLLATLQHAGPVRSIAFSPDGRSVATASEDHTARLWSADSGEPTSGPLPHIDVVRSVRFSPDGTRLVTAGDSRDNVGGSGQLWNVRSGRPIGAPMSHEADVVLARFDSGGRRVVTASDDRTARIWDAFTGAPLTPPLWHEDSLADAAFNPDGRRLATLSTEGILRLWESDTGESITPPMPQAHRYDVGQLHWNPSEQTLLAVTGGDWAYLYRFVANQESVENLLLQAQLWSAHHIEAQAGRIPLTTSGLSNAWESLKRQLGDQTRKDSPNTRQP